MQQPYNADYFLRGKEAGVSNYTDYRWLEEPTMALAQRVIEVMWIKVGDSFLDFGCARGYLVKAMRRLGIDFAYGYDISDWAIANCDPEVVGKVFAPPTLEDRYDHVWGKDVLEHVNEDELRVLVPQLIRIAQKSALFIVPLTEKVGGPYLREEDNFDKTHVIRWPLENWVDLFKRSMGARTMMALHSSHHIPGLKPASLTHPKSCGFITLRRI